MKKKDIINDEYPERLDDVLKLSWKVFKSQFINKKYGDIEKEAPFQLHFAQIINNVGDLYSISKIGRFKIGLETKSKKKIKEKYKYIDITCEFRNRIKCAIELKFKTKKQGAKNNGRIDAYVDISALETLTSVEYNLDDEYDEYEYDIGKFYMITNDSSYVNKSKKGIGTIFSTHDGFISDNRKKLSSNSKGRENVKINLRDSYQFDWEEIDGWYFLELTIKKEVADYSRFIWEDGDCTVVKNNE